MSDNFKFVIPADLEKSKDGEWRIRGLASTESVDQQGESIIQKGIDLTPIDKKKGIINFDHMKGPENTIGLLDGYTRTDRGLFIEGRLFKNHTKARAVYEIMSSLAEGDRGRVGLSVEGRILERDAKNPSIIKKCSINAVAVTLSPVNSDTFANLVKSMNSAESLEIDSEEQASLVDSVEPTFTASQVMTMIQKALSIGAGAMGAPDAKTGGDALQPSDMKAEKCEKCKKAKCECVEKGGPGSGVKGHKTIKDRQLGKYYKVHSEDKTHFHAEDHFGDRVKINRTQADEVDENEAKNFKYTKRAERLKRMKKMDKSMYKSSLIGILDKLQVLYPNHSRADIWEAVKERLETKFEKGIRIKNTSGKEREHKLYEEARQRDDYEANKDKSRAELNELAEQSGADKHSKEKIRAQADAAKQVGDRGHVRPNIKG